MTRIAADDRAAGIGLSVATAVALVWANWPAATGYARFWTATAAWSGAVGLGLSNRDWVDQGLMLGFFVVIGLEIGRERRSGSWHRAALPVAAAVIGMAIPALLFVAIEVGGPGARAWAIPTATDVAFALGALALLARPRAPRARVFLMTLAVADDVLSIVLLGALYSRGVHPRSLVTGLLLIGAMAAARRAGTPGWVVVALGVASWWALLHSGVEAALVGAAIGVLAPRANPRHWELRLAPFVNLGVLPVFALANAGVRVAGSGLTGGPALRIMVAVIVARVVGKLVGIGAVLGLARSGTGGIDRRVGVGVGLVASVGFTVPLLVIHAALPDGPLAAGATMGLLVASVLGAAGAAVALRRPARRPEPPNSGVDRAGGIP